MIHNVGGWDRNTRLIVGSGALVAGLVAPIPKSWRMGLLALGAIELITGSTRYCPMNAALGIDTRRKEQLRTIAEVAQTMV